eukprot:s395_g46.t1
MRRGSNITRLRGLFRRANPETCATSVTRNTDPVEDEFFEGKRPPTFLQQVSAKSGGRCGTRVRHLYRHSRALLPSNGLSVGTLNTQGLQWNLLIHRDKLSTVLRIARERRLDVLTLSELHFQEVNQPAVVYIEEFLCVRYMPTSEEGLCRFSLEEMKQDNERVSCDRRPVNTQVIAGAVRQQAIDETMGFLPSRQEFSRALAALKESAPGQDNVTATMLKNCGSRAQEQLYSMICQMWTTDAAQWDQLLTTGIGVMLFKNGKRVAFGDIDDIDLHFVWQAWHLVTWSFVLCGRRGAYETGLGLDGLTGSAWGDWANYTASPLR